MSEKTAQILFILFNILAFFSVFYAVNDFFVVSASINSLEGEIPFDSGTYYFLLMSVFWVFSFIQYLGLKKPESSMLKISNKIVVVWFIFVLFLANAIPYYLESKFMHAGYIKCDDPREISRVAKGSSSIYKKAACDDF